MKPWVIACCAAAPFAAPPGAGAQPAAEGADAREQARALFEQGLATYESGDVAAAAELFQQSVDLRASPTALYNLAMCRRDLEMKEESIAAFRRFVEMRGADLPAADRAEIDAMVREMGGTLEPPPGGEGAAGGSGTTSSGEEGAGGTGEAGTDIAGGGGSTGAGTQHDGAATPPVEDGSGLDPLWFWVAAGTAGALGVGAGVTGGLTYSAHNDFVDGGSTDADLKDQGDVLRNTTNALIGVAAAAAGAAVVLVFFTDWGDEESPDGGDDGATAVAWPGGFAVSW